MKLFSHEDRYVAGGSASLSFSALANLGSRPLRADLFADDDTVEVAGL